MISNQDKNSKGFLRFLLEDDESSDLKVAIVLFMATGFFLLNLFQSAAIDVISPIVVDEILPVSRNFFYNYFLDFSEALSSTILIIGFVTFIWTEIVLINLYISTENKSFIWSIVGVLVAFFVVINTMVPLVKNIENNYIAKKELSIELKNKEYIYAYGYIDGLQVSEYEKVYMNTQVSMIRYLEDQSNDNESVFNSDAKLLNDYIVDGNKTANMKDEVLYKIYKVSSEKESILGLKAVSDRVNRNAMIWFILSIISLVFAIYKVKKHKALFID